MGKPCTGRAVSSFLTSQKGEGQGEAEGKSWALVVGARGHSHLIHGHRVLCVMEATVYPVPLPAVEYQAGDTASLCLFLHLKYGIMIPTSEG